MKCKKCGAEVSPGDIYCPKCGTEIQIVPDYNVFEEDFSDVITQKQTTPRDLEHQPENDTNKEDEGTKKKRLVILISIGVVALIAIIFVVSLIISNNNKNKSFTYNFTRAEGYLENGLPDKALESINKALKVDKDNEDGNILKSVILVELGEKEKAINILLSVVSDYPDSLKAYELLISLYAEDSDYTSIQTLSEKVENDAIYSLFLEYVAEVPKFSIEPGKYEEEIQLALTSNDEAIIYYTLDGSSPKSNGILYTSEITLEEGKTTVRAYATNEYGIISDELEGTYEISLAPPKKPEVSLPSGTYDEVMQITIYVPNNWKAYYTWDGSNPNTSSILYTGPFDIIEGNNILSVILVNDDNKVSDIARFNYIYYPETSVENGDGSQGTGGN